MGRNKKNKPKLPQTPPAQQASPVSRAPTQAPSQQTPASSAPTASSPASSVSLSLAVSILAVVVSGTISLYSLGVSKDSLAISKQAQEMNQRAQDRASGKIQAKFEYIDFHDDPEKMRPFIKKEIGTDKDVFRLDSLDELLRWHPAVKIKNTGDEMIDSVRVDVWFMGGRVYGFGVKQLHPMPIIVNKISSREVSSFGKIRPQQTATIHFLPLLLSQMLQARSKDFPDKDREDNYRVQVACRLVGAATHDNSGGLILNLHWKQPGFADEQKCMQVLKMQNVLVAIE